MSYLTILIADDIHAPNKSQTTDHSCLLQDCANQVCRDADCKKHLSGGESSVLMENEVLTLSDEERKSLLQKVSISNNAIGSAEVLAIKAGMAIPWNRMRLLRW